MRSQRRIKENPVNIVTPCIAFAVFVAVLMLDGLFYDFSISVFFAELFRWM